MNERIRELAEQAGFDHMGIWKIIGIEEYHQKFAELIIRECAELTLDHKNDDYYAGWLDYRDEIKRHFGVEE
jgi:hypothetical protein